MKLEMEMVEPEGQVKGSENGRYCDSSACVLSEDNRLGSIRYKYVIEHRYPKNTVSYLPCLSP